MQECMVQTIPEIDRILALAKSGQRWLRVHEQGSVSCNGQRLPLLGLTMGPDDPTLPTLGLFGGVHGLEQVGAQVVLHFLECLVSRLHWDHTLQTQLEQVRIVAMPVINPGGFLLRSRANPAGVDLMRNAPVDATEKVTPLVGGHRIGNWLPWFRGNEGDPMEPEAQALVDFVDEQMFSSRHAIALDVHSGFGSIDRLWYPFARSVGDYPRTQECELLAQRLQEFEPNHVYRIEPQATQYTTHGDLWDHIFDLHQERHGLDGNLFLPWTLEMGSWVWLKKNPWQIFGALGAFNPIKPHRHRRVMRRHARLIEFLLHLTSSAEHWQQSTNEAESEKK
jgi:hypothetical protein